MLAVRALLEVPGLLAGPVWCRVTGRHRWHVWRHHAAPGFHICIRCGRSA